MVAGSGRGATGVDNSLLHSQVYKNSGTDSGFRVRGQVLPARGVEAVGDGRGLAPPGPLDRPSRHLKTKWDKRDLGRNSRDIAAFREYLELTGKLTLDLTLYDMEKHETVVLHLPYMHRWNPQYRNQTLARFYKFNEWWLEQGRPPLTLLTLTTYQDGEHSREQVGGYTIEESFEILKTSWEKPVICYGSGYFAGHLITSGRWNPI